MPERVTDTWSWRDQPVLESIVETYDADGLGTVDVRPKRIANLIALTERQVDAALNALLDAGLIRGQVYAGGVMVNYVSAQARRQTGSWPSDDLGERYLAALNRLIDASSGTERTKLQALRDASMSVGNNALGDLIARAISGMAGGLSG